MKFLKKNLKFKKTLSICISLESIFSYRFQQNLSENYMMTGSNVRWNEVPKNQRFD
jgi:hypothetical protein